MDKFIEMTGKQMWNWTVIKKVKVPGETKAMFLCRCICGTEKAISGTRLRRGVTKSCGCDRKELTTEENFHRNMLCNYKSTAKRRNHDFDLSKEKFIELIHQNCYYCGVKPSNCFKIYEDVFYYSGLDRVDSSKGYTKNNIVPCCKKCNRGKSDLSVDEFKNHALKMAKHLKII